MGQSSNLKIESDFTDYYDNLSNNDGIFRYNRFLSTSLTRSEDLRWLAQQGVKTIDIKAVSSYNDFSGIDKLVVYTNPKAHNGSGKTVVSLSEAKHIYPNYLASPFYDEADGVTLKVLQVGSKRYRLLLKNNTNKELVEGDIINIEKLPDAFNYLMLLPIFSIDYISTRHGMLAVDYNRVQNLDKLRFNRFITAEDVVNEIIESLIAYNKC